MDKKMETAQIKWARRMEGYIAIIRKDKLKVKDVDGLLEDLDITNKSYIDERVKLYCRTKKGLLLRTLKENYKSKESVAQALGCFPHEISFYPSEEVNFKDYKCVLWTDDLSIPEMGTEIPAELKQTENAGFEAVEGDDYIEDEEEYVENAEVEDTNENRDYREYEEELGYSEERENSEYTDEEEDVLE